MSKYRYNCTKQYFNLPCAHRQHGHDGHCRFIHGYSRSFKFYFACNELDANNFVFDFGELKELKEHLEYMCDHTLLINEQDPYLEMLKATDTLSIDAGWYRVHQVTKCNMMEISPDNYKFDEEV